MQPFHSVREQVLPKDLNIATTSKFETQDKDKLSIKLNVIPESGSPQSLDEKKMAKTQDFRRHATLGNPHDNNQHLDMFAADQMVDALQPINEAEEKELAKLAGTKTKEYHTTKAAQAQSSLSKMQKYIKVKDMHSESQSPGSSRKDSPLRKQ